MVFLSLKPFADAGRPPSCLPWQSARNGVSALRYALANAVPVAVEVAFILIVLQQFLFFVHLSFYPRSGNSSIMFRHGLMKSPGVAASTVATPGDHEAAAKHYEDAAAQMQAKVNEKKELLEHYEDKSYLYGRQAQDLSSYRSANTPLRADAKVNMREAACTGKWLRNSKRTMPQSDTQELSAVNALHQAKIRSSQGNAGGLAYVFGGRDTLNRFAPAAATGTTD